MCWAWKTAFNGETVDQPWGDICDGDEKRKMVLETCALLAHLAGEVTRATVRMTCMMRLCSGGGLRSPTTPNPPCGRRPWWRSMKAG
jgi:hypothetical protein